jgi:filamentous hemagglutinin family protein
MKKAFVAGCRAALVLAMAPLSSLAGGPTGGVVVGGNPVATITGQGTSLTTINQSANQAIINWQQFSIGAGDTVKFVQPSANAIALNRILSGDPTQIYGSLQANGRVIVINPNGIMVGPGGTIDTKGFIASTLDVPDNMFLSGGPMLFSGQSTAAVKNQGTIRALGGDVFLIAHTVDNSGTITAPQGTVGLAAGSQVELVPSGDERISVLAGNASSTAAIGVNNSGAIAAASAELKAAGGNIYALAINNGGVIRATGIVNENGHIYLRAAGGNIQNSGTLAAQNADGSGGTIVMDGGHNAVNPATVINSGTIDASGTTGGMVEMLGDNVGLFDNALVDVSGNAGGGTALIGGDLHGANSAIQDAEHTFISPDATIKADALTQGNGGEIVVWSDDVSRDFGTLSATGGSAGGNGGFMEVSSKGVLDFDGAVDLNAPAGIGGTLLLDPVNITISTAAATVTVFNPPTVDTEAFADDNLVSSTFHVNADGTSAGSSFAGVGNGATIDLQAQNNITVANTFNIQNETGNNNVSLNLQAGNNININAAVTASGTGTLTLSANDNGGGTATGTGAVNFGASGSLTTAGQTINVSGAGITVGGNGITATGNTANAGGNITLNATGTLALNAPIVTEGGTATTVGLNGGNVQLSGATITSTGGSVNTSGSAAANGIGGSAGTITTTSTGAATIGNLTANGGAGAGLAGGDAAEISVSAASGITLNNSLAALGGAGTSSGNNAPISLSTTAGGVTQSSGTLDSGGLLLLGAGTFNVADAGNTVGTLASSAAGSVTYVDAGALAVGTVLGTSGIVSTGNDVNLTGVGVTVGATGINATGGADAAGGNITLNATGTLALNAPIVTEGGTATTVGLNGGNVLLTGSTITTTGGSVNTSGSAATTGIGGAAGTITANSTGAITIGNLTANGAAGSGAAGGDAAEISVSAASGITLNNSLTALGGAGTPSGNNAPISLSATAGGVAQSSGTLDSGGLLLLGAGAFNIIDAGNTVGTLAANVAGSLTYRESGALTVSTVLGTSGITSGNSPITVSTANSPLTIAKNINAGSGTANLTAGGSGNMLTINASAGVTGTGGVNLSADNMTIAASASINAGAATATLAQSQNGVAIKLGGANGIATLGLTSTELNTVTAGTLQIGNANSGALTVVAPITAPATAGTFSLRSGSTITQNPGDTITVAGAGILNLQSAGTITLNEANQVPFLSITGGTAQFTDAQSLMISAINDPGKTVTLAANGPGLTLGENSLITAGQLNLNNWGATTLTLANQVGVLTATTAGTGALQFETGGAVDIQGISDPTQTVTLSGTGAASTVTESTGIINASTLVLNNLGTTTLNQANTVGILKGTGLAATLQFTDAQSLDVQGFSGPGQTATLTGNTGLTLSESSGTILLGQLFLNNWDSATLTQPNVIDHFSATTTAAGTLQFEDAQNLTVLGINAPNQTVTLAAGGVDNLSESGAITASQLNVNSWNTVNLPQANQVGVLTASAPGTGSYGFTAGAGTTDVQGISDAGQTVTLSGTSAASVLKQTTGIINVSTLALNNLGNTTLNQANTVGNLTISGAAGATQFTDANSLTIQGIGAAGKTVTLTGNGLPTTLNETSGITASQLNLNNWAATSLFQNNQVAALSAAGITGTFDFFTVSALDIRGISDPGFAVTLAGGGSPTVTESAGVINTPTLNLQSLGATTLNQANTVGNLQVTGAGGALQFTDAQSLNVQNVAATGQAVTIAATGDNNELTVVGGDNVTGSSVTLAGDQINLAGTVTTPGVAWIHESTAGRQITVGTDDVSAPTASGGTLGLTIPELSSISAGTLHIGDAASGNVSVTVLIAPLSFSTLSLQSGATISEAPGTAVTIGSLAAQAASGINLTTGNSVGTFAAITPGMLQFVNAGSLTIGNAGGLSGIQAGGGAAITAESGTLTVSSPISGPSGITLTANALNITAPINSGGANTIFQPFTAGISADFGAPIAGDLNLTQAELNEVTANVLQIGNNLSGVPANANFVVAPLTVHQLEILGGNSSITLLSQQLAALSSVETPTPTLQVAQFSSASLSLDEVSKILPAGAIGTIWLQLPFPHETTRTYKVEDISKWTSGPMASVGSTAGPQSPR